MEEGFTAATQLIFYLVADGYKIVTDLCHVSARLRGEYDGTETGLAEGVRPEVLMQPGPDFKGYVAEKARVQIVGVYRGEGLIAEAVDEWDGSVNTTMTSNNVLHLRGNGLKIEGDAAHAGEVGLFFDDGTSAPVKAKVIAVNEPKTVKVVIPDDLSQGKSFSLKIVTQSSTKSSKHILKEVREVRSEFKLKFLRRPGTFTEGSGEAGNGGGAPAGQDANPAQA